MSPSLPGTVSGLSKGYNQVWHEQSRSNQGLEPTASSVRCAPAFGSSSGLAFGIQTLHRTLFAIMCDIR